MTKKIAFIAFLGMCLFLNSSAYANHTEGGNCPVGKHGYGEKDGKHGQCPVGGQFMRKAQFLLQHQSDLGLTEEQVKTIKDLKLQIEKDNISQKADMETFMLDLKSSLREDQIDVEATKALIDKGFSSASIAAKSNVEGYAKLKAVLTPDQSAKLKELFKDKKSSWEGKSKDTHEHKDE